MRAKIWSAVLAVAFAAALGAAWLLSRPVSTDGSAKVRIAQTGDFLLYAGLYIAKDAGIFANNGLDATIVSTGGDEKSAAAVLSGQAEFGVGDPTFAAIANSRGQDLKFFASVVNGIPFWGVTYRQDVIERYRAGGLRGLRVATFPAPSTAFALQTEMFRAAGLPPAIQQGAFGSLQGLLEARQADIALELEPNVSLAQSRGATVLYSMAANSGDFSITGVLANARYLRGHPQEAKAFCRSLDQAFAFIRENPDRTAHLLQVRFADLPADVIAAALKRVVAEGVIPATAQTNERAWERALELRKSVGDLPDAVTASSAIDKSVCRPTSIKGT